MWIPKAPTPPERIETTDGHYVACPSLSLAAARLMPIEPGHSVRQVAELDDFYSQLREHEQSSDNWGLFSHNGYNFAVLQPLSFLLQVQPPTNTEEEDGGCIQVIDHQAPPESIRHLDHFEADGGPETLFMDGVQATMLEVAEAIEVEGTTIAPAILCSFINVEGISGYEGCKAWVIASKAQTADELFLIPGQTPNSMDGRTERERRIREVAPNLGPLCALQSRAVVTNLLEVSLDDKVQP